MDSHQMGIASRRGWCDEQSQAAAWSFPLAMRCEAGGLSLRVMVTPVTQISHSKIE